MESSATQSANEQQSSSLSKGLNTKAPSAAASFENFCRSALRQDIPDFAVGDTIKVHAKIVEGSKERIQVFEGVVLSQSKSAKQPNATFTVRKVSYNIGVERIFYLHSPRIEKIELVKKGSVRRARLYYLRPLRGKATRIKTKADIK
jgi:large subunit ribosomal protein L19